MRAALNQASINAERNQPTSKYVPSFFFLLGHFYYDVLGLGGDGGWAGGGMLTEFCAFDKARGPVRSR